MNDIIATNQPLWIKELRKQVELHGQKKVALEIGYSHALVSQVINGKYSGDLNSVERAVRGAYLGDTVNCPVMGELESNRCMQFQKEPFTATNPVRVKRFRACRSGCIYSSLDAIKKLNRNHRHA